MSRSRLSLLLSRVSAYGAARALSYTVVSGEETAKWAFQRTMKRPASRPSQQVGHGSFDT
jgi:hypothetical protein